MTSPQSDSDDAPPKRMRLGTRSCAECRRRKVRCVFGEQATVCQNCSLHDVPCRAQQPRQQEKRKAAAKARDEEKDALQRRVEQLEGMVRQIYGAKAPEPGPEKAPQSAPLSAVGSGPGSDSWSPVFVVPDAQSSTGMGVCSLELRTPESCSAAPAGNAQTSSHLGPADAFSDAEDGEDQDQFDDAPFINLFKESLLLHKPDQADSLIGPNPSRDDQIRDIVVNIMPMIPQMEDLEAVFSVSRKFWFTWPSCRTGLGPKDTLQQSGIQECIRYVSSALMGTSAAEAAKAMLWMALCTTQVPTHWPQRSKLPATPKAMVEAYIRTARDLISIAVDRNPSIETIEALVLQFKLFLDLARVRQAWSSNRQALSIGLLLGLHRLEPTSDPRRKALWADLWHADFSVSVVIGLPAAISSTHPGLSLDLLDPNDPPLSRLGHAMMIVAGRVTERDQARGTTGYSQTVQLDAEWEATRSLMPPDFWTPNPSQSELDADPVLAAAARARNTPFEALYWSAVVKMMYWQTGKYIHLPYLLRATREPKYAPSRVACLAACRSQVREYLGLRAAQDVVFCELMDFQSFGAALVILIDVLSRRGGMRGHVVADVVGEVEADLVMVDELVGGLRATSSRMECSVAARGARLLEMLVGVYRGTYAGPREGCDLVIPYFGRIRVSFPSGAQTHQQPSVSPVAPSTTSPVVQSSGGMGVLDPLAVLHTVVMPSPVVEFGSNLWNNTVPFDFDVDAELQGQWSTTLEFDQQNYGWMEAFDVQSMMQ